ncbi:glycosyltransferase [Methylomonas sp. LL1]|uniref:glycosyltransferase family 2 protein n=1 Tax=Methylomonas sp. LL1 TaxID=2785785 RepID=UPI0018C435DD|nr:glycosyltransferase [Methylomonas sp. LL1]QPK62723.1 glycosyltransferase [Methylomonas sp. LL1]
MKASIVILNWKGKVEDCAEAVESAIAQSYEDKEIIFVDNGSNDDALTLLKSQYPKINYIGLPDNLGVTGGRNKGAEACEGDVIFFLENDGAWATKNVVEDAVKLFERYKHLGVLYTAVEGYESGIKDRTVDLYADTNDEILISSSFRGGAAVIRKSLFEQIGGYPDDYFRQCEEKYFSMFVYDLGYYIGYAPLLIMRHKGSDYQGKSNVVNWYNCINDLKNLIRHYPGSTKYGLILAKVLLWTGRFVRSGKIRELIKVYTAVLFEIWNNSKHKKVKKQTVSFIEALGCNAMEIRPFSEYLTHSIDNSHYPSPFLSKLTHSLHQKSHSRGRA